MMYSDFLVCYYFGLAAFSSFWEPIWQIQSSYQAA